MKRLVITPKGWPCTLAECPEGLFVFDGRLGLKSEYKSEAQNGHFKCDAYVVESGEYFWGGAIN